MAGSSILLVTVSGHDQPGLLAMLAATLAGHQARVLDIGQAVIHEQLNLARPEAPVSGEALDLRVQHQLAAIEPAVGLDHCPHLVEQHLPRYAAEAPERLLQAGEQRVHRLPDRLLNITCVLLRDGALFDPQRAAAAA